MAPTLPGISTNGITGIWNPATISTSTIGSTKYTFIPTSGPCITTTSMDITIASQITPVFTAIGPLCQNSSAPAFPAISNNGITGTWNPAVINTAVAGTTVYTFTPDPGQCGISTTLEVTVDAQAVPTFAAMGNLCQNSTAPVLPLSSTDTPAITGTWNPAVINTAVAGTTVYTFTPDAGQCATTTTLSVTVDAQAVPTFAAMGNLCQNSTAPVLPLSSTDTPAITGTWNPAVINTAVAGTTVYTFTPDAGQCATTTTLSVTVDAQAVSDLRGHGQSLPELNSTGSSFKLNRYAGHHRYLEPGSNQYRSSRDNGLHLHS